VSGQQHAPAVIYPRERPGTHCTGGWVGPRAGLDRCEKSHPHRDSTPDRPARSQSLYRLNYRVHSPFSISITHSECVSVALGIQHAKRMRRIIFSSVAGPAVQYFHTPSHKRPNFRKENYCTQNARLDFFYNFVRKIFLIFKKKSARYYHKCVPGFCKVPVIPVRF
jgi:hypothetical protein